MSEKEGRLRILSAQGKGRTVMLAVPVFYIICIPAPTKNKKVIDYDILYIWKMQFISGGPIKGLQMEIYEKENLWLSLFCKQGFAHFQAF